MSHPEFMPKHFNGKIIRLIQECAEVQKEATKLLLFGAENRWPDENSLTNWENLQREICDLYEAMEEINFEMDEFGK